MIIYLYAKRHRITGLRYFGKTRQDPYKYKGSGSYWAKHLKVHGSNVETTWVQAYTDEETLVKEAEFFSKVYNIAESDEWANLTFENGLDGRYDVNGKNNPMYGKKHSEEVKQAHRERMTGRKQSAETIAKRVAKNKGQKRPNQSESLKAAWAKRKNNA
jgi:hypothetical protein